MPVLNLLIRNNIHQIACAEGQEEHLQALAANLDNKIKRFSEVFTKATDSTLLVMAALTLEDELYDLKNKQSLGIETAQKEEFPEKDEPAIDLAVADALDAISEYVENLANKLEKM